MLPAHSVGARVSVDERLAGPRTLRQVVPWPELLFMTYN